MTAKYNGWFNANELLEESILKLEEQHEDNYNEILPLYEYVAVDNADAVKADLDEAIKKVSVVVTLHEYSDWSDDCYLLIGKSLYLKQDYEAAENAFEFYMDEFLPNGKRTTIRERKKKKSSASSNQSSSEVREANRRQKELQKARKKAEKERKKYNKELRKRRKKGQPTDDLVRPGTVKAPDGTTQVPTSDIKKYEPTQAELKAKMKAEGEQSGIFLNESVYDEAILWLAKSYIERENWTSADYQFRRLETDDILPPKVYEELPVARAYYHMKRENYPQVIPFLEQAIERAGNRNLKARYSYIIAQLHDRAGNTAKAGEYYQKSLDFATKYDMEFNTQLSFIRSSVKNNTMTRTEAQAQLEKMVKDSKNEPYLGRIYYVMATLALESGDVMAAIDHLELSVASVGQDKFQEVESQYLLATLYMQTLQYVDAEKAYKACAAIMKSTDPRYRSVKKLADNLTDIAINLNEISYQDSMLRMSYLSEDELKALAKEIKKRQQEEAKAAAANNKYQGGFNTKTSPNPAAGSPGGNIPGVGLSRTGAASNVSFWAYDTKNLKKTKREFERTWGDISLTDHWRVSARASQFLSNEDFAVQGDGAEIGLYESEIEDYFKDVPKSDSARAICHNQIRKAMLLLGGLYRDRLEDFKSSIEVLEEILTRYPDAPEKLEIYYQLYLSSLSAGDHERAERYKTLIISQYPNSRFAKVLSDPNFAASQLSELERLVQYYDATYQVFETGDHEEVLSRVKDAEEQFGGNNVMMGKFELLKAMSLGAQLGKDAYVEALKYVIARYPNSDEEKKAKDMLLLLGDAASSKTYGETGLSKANFTIENNALHFVIVYVQNQEEISLNDSKVAIAEFHKKYFQLDNLKMTSLVFDPAKNHSLILVRSFTTKDRAMNYFETAIRNPNDFLPKNAIFEVYPITQKNYREVIKARELGSYKEFFEANY
jgi:tetratricopeptide (TPR) repeat protein